MFLFVNILFLGGVKAQTANNAITLRNEKLNFIPGEFYIAGVADERTEKDIVATLVYKEGVAYKTRLADLKDGAANAIKLFITRNLSQNTDLRPVIVTLHDFKLAETDSGAGGVNGHLTMAISFGLRKDYGVLELVEYKSGLRYMRSYGQTEFPETILRHGIEGAIKWFNNWIEEYAQKDIRLAKSVSVAFSDYTEKPEGDTIYYAVNRPLAWDDFKDKPRAGVFDAEIFAGIGYTEHVEVEKGVIKLEIAVKVDMPKSGSWVKSNALDAYSLNHEQRHFDIAKIVGEHFKKKIAAMGVTPDNYEASISMEYLETLRELTSMQNQYDHDTHHGNDRRAQADWNTRIDEELKELGVK